MNQDKEAIERYYDEFAHNQSETGVNERLFACYVRLKKIGLLQANHVLELGCGVGAFSGLIQRHLPSGALEAVDLSSTSIAIAKNKIGSSVNFAAADILTYQPKTALFDFILLLDVIEHVPLELHTSLWERYVSKLKQGGKLVINLPNPNYLEWERKEKPEQLQILDQPIPIPHLIQQLYQSGLQLNQFETYSVWSENDYHFIVFEKPIPYQEKFIRHSSSLLLRLKLKIWHYWLKWSYN